MNTETRLLHKTIIALVICLVLMSFFITSNFKNLSPVNKINGVCWVAGDSIVSTNLDSLVKNRVKWISQTPFAYMDGHDNPDLSYDYRRGWWGERDAGLIYTTALAHEKGIKVMLKPHIWISNANGKWRSDIEMKSDEEWELWFCNYEEMILQYATIAANANMDALCIGTELLIPSTKFKNRWIDIIHKIRAVYKGQLTYAANFYKEYEKIEFWSELDYIGVQAYFPIARKKHPSLKELKNNWNKHSKKLKKLAEKYNKKVVFTEVGYKNTADAAIEPWLWPRQLEREKIEGSEKVQADCYEAMFSMLWDKEWFGGVFIWKWFHGNYQYSFNDYRNYRRERRKKYAESIGRPIIPNIEFSPQGKEAELVMRKYFNN